MKRRTRNYAKRQLTWMRKLAGRAADRRDGARARCDRARAPRLRRAMRFEKWQALGNDYLIVERDELPLELTPRAHPPALRPAPRRRLRRRAAALAARRPRARRRPADLQPRRLRGRALGQRRPRGDHVPAPRAAGPTATSSRSARSPASIRPTIHGPETCTVDMGRAASSSADFPGGPPDGRGECRRSAGVALPPRLDRQPAVRDPRGRARSSRRSTSPRSARRSRHELFPNRTNVSWYTRSRPGRRRASARGSSSAGWGRRSPRARARAAPRSPTYRARPRSPRTSYVLDGGELEVELGDDLHVTLTGWARPVFDGSPQRRLRQGAG